MRWLLEVIIDTSVECAADGMDVDVDGRKENRRDGQGEA